MPACKGHRPACRGTERSGRHLGGTRRQHEDGGGDGFLRYVPNKTGYKRMTPSEKPIILELAHIIANSPTEDMTFVVTEQGKPFSVEGFGNWFRDRCKEVGLPHCTAHGLRKAGCNHSCRE